MRLNPRAVVFWGVCACAGWLINGANGLVWGLGIGLTLSLVITR